jgi:hypothetical protein
VADQLLDGTRLRALTILDVYRWGGAGDEVALRRILAEPDASPDVMQGPCVGADLIRVLRQFEASTERIAATWFRLLTGYLPVLAN